MAWICGECGFVHDGDGPPKVCPLCGADRKRFTEFKMSSV